ncbi:MAG: crotonase/enoyl-CoA hydratase family protein [Rhizobiales bacterium]|nr:crotonase/enoyl-CoA hydratase family protein [Hyphomicrobiales bacterium]
MYAYSNGCSPGRAIAHAKSFAAIAPAVPVIDPKVIDLKKSADALRLFELEQLEVTWEEQIGALWTFMRPRGRPSYNTDLLEDFHAWQRGIVAAFEYRPDELKYLLLGSRTAGVFNLGGDLDLFAAKIRQRDRQTLVAYGESCVRILHRNMTTLGLPMITIGLAQGDALGGGFESLLSFNIIIAERGTKFGFPETMFGLFPGMGAYSLVARRTGAAFAEEMMLSGKTYTAEQMKDAGLIHMVVEPGQGIEAARDYIQRNKRRHAGARAVFQAGREVNPVTLEELDRIVQIWADACLQLSERDLKVMQRLVSAQDRLNPNLQAAE